MNERRKRDYSTSLTIRLPFSLRRAVEQAAERSRTSMSEIVLIALRAYLDKKEDRR